ncbi:MAG: hypothetical protein MJ197_08380 [Bacteroidales bacterium]|nr:hypothetical protein [Bacteroidales bacterium]
MKKFLSLVFAFCVAMGSVSAQSRLLNKALNAATQGVTNAVTKKVESVAEKQMTLFLNKKLSAYEKHLTEENARYQALVGSWQDSLVAMSSVPFEDEYTFNTIVAMDMTVDDGKNGKETIQCTYYLNASADYYAYAIENMVTVVDHKNAVMVCFSTEDTAKVYFAYKYVEETVSKSDDGLDSFDTKTICGYSCKGYSTNNLYFKGKAYVSNSPDFAGNAYNRYTMGVAAKGFCLYYEGVATQDDGTKGTYICEAKSVKKNADFKIKKSDYKNMFAE